MLVKTCVMCGGQGIHKCPGGRVAPKYTTESELRCAQMDGAISIAPGLVDANHFNGDNYDGPMTECPCGGAYGWYPELDPEGEATGRECYCLCAAGQRLRAQEAATGASQTRH